MKSLLYSAATLSLLLPFAVNSATLGSYPSQDASQGSCNETYNQGFNTGYFAAYESGYNDGYNDAYNSAYTSGLSAQLAACIADPQGCNISFSSCIPDALVGETEPNDSFVTADPLQPGTSFWAQLYGLNDRDWFYTTTTTLNQNLLITFSVPQWLEGANLAEGNPGLWNISVLDAAGNVFASFDSNARSAIQSTPDSLTYSVTLGLAGTYYIRVQPAAGGEINAHTYSISALVQDSPLGGAQPIVGFYDTEMERNDLPSQGNRLANGVSMYGVINLTFNTPILDGDTAVWGQGEDDWFKYTSPGNEIVTLTFCDKEECPLGDWLVEVYDQSMANRYEAGEPRDNLTPILAINTNNSGDANRIFRFGLSSAGDYYVRVNHKRLFDAPCNVYQYVSTTSPTGFSGLCECESGNSCDIPTDGCSDVALGLVCKKQESDCIPGIEPACVSAVSSVGALTSYQTVARCSCSQYGGVVAIPEGSYTSPYNFTWHGTRLPPSTADSDAYTDYENRPTPY
jgi:hypothetical protein